MNHYFSNEKNKFPFLLCIIFSGILTVAEPIFGSEPAGRTGGPLGSSERSAYEDRKALEAYEKRNAEIDSRIQGDLMPSHNNAALLYYQAFLQLPDANGAIKTKIYDVYGGDEPDTQIRIFLGKCLPALELFEIASLMPQCTWGVWSEEQNSRNFLGRKLFNLSYIISIDAYTLATDCHYRAALKQCLTLRRIVKHLSEDPELYLFSKSCDLPAFRTIRRILSKMPPNADVLAWFQGQLSLIQVTPLNLEKTLQIYLKAKIDKVQSSSIPRLRGMLLKRAADERARQHIRNLTDDQIRNQALEAVQGFFGSIFAILHSNKSAEQKYAEIQEICEPTMITDLLKLFDMVHDKFGDNILSLMMGIHLEMTEEQKLSEIQKIIDKSAEPDTIELLTTFSHAVGEDIDFGFLVNREMTDKQKHAEMQKVIYDLGEALAIETSKFGLSWIAIEKLIKTQLGSHTAQINSVQAAVELYLIMVKTGQLPEELPDYLPKDPYTGRNFLYEITDDGFVIGCRSDIFKRGNERFTFGVQKKNN